MDGEVGNVKLLKLAEVAERLGVSIRTVERMVKQRLLPSVKVLGATRVPLEALAEFVKAQTRGYR